MTKEDSNSSWDTEVHQQLSYQFVERKRQKYLKQVVNVDPMEVRASICYLEYKKRETQQYHIFLFLHITKIKIKFNPF